MHTRVFLGEEKKQKKMREGRRKKKKICGYPCGGLCEYGNIPWRGGV